MDSNPFYQRKEDAAARTQARRRPNRPNRNRRDQKQNQRARERDLEQRTREQEQRERERERQQNDPGGQKKRNWWGNYNPDPTYDPDNPYYAPPPEGQRGSGKVPRQGRRIGEENHEAMWGNLLGRSGISYRAGSEDPYQQYLRKHFANAEQGFEQARIDRPGLTWWKYLQQTPAYHQGAGTAPPPPVVEPPPAGGGGRPGGGRPGGGGGRPGGGRR